MKLWGWLSIPYEYFGYNSKMNYSTSIDDQYYVDIRLCWNSEEPGFD